MSVQVAFFSRYGNLGASSRYRFIQYFDIYSSKGLTPVLQPFYSDEYLKRRYAGKITVLHAVAAFIRRFIQILVSRHRYPLIVIEYEMLPFFPRSIEKLALKWVGSPYIVEYDDAIYLRYERNASPFYRTKISRLLEEASLVIAGSHYLREQLLYRGAKNVAMVPTSVSSKKGLDRSESSSHCTIVWIGSNTTAQYVGLISNVLHKLLKGNVRLMVIGAGDWRLNGNENVIYKEWSEDEEAKLLAECDIGIMPLPDNDWARGKCGLKIIQYMMAGLPVVASKVGANVEIITHRVDGFLASADDEWFRYLEKLVSNVDLRRQMGESGKRQALAKYCVEKNATMIMSHYISQIRNNDSEVELLRRKLQFGGHEK